MQLSVSTLKATEIGRAVNQLRKHNSQQIRFRLLVPSLMNKYLSWMLLMCIQQRSRFLWMTIRKIQMIFGLHRAPIALVGLIVGIIASAVTLYSVLYSSMQFHCTRLHPQFKCHISYYCISCDSDWHLKEF